MRRAIRRTEAAAGRIGSPSVTKSGGDARAPSRGSGRSRRRSLSWPNRASPRRAAWPDRWGGRKSPRRPPAR
eukprot:5804129-Pyramimonas_sp.AAC.1